MNFRRNNGTAQTALTIDIFPYFKEDTTIPVNVFVTTANLPFFSLIILEDLGISLLRDSAKLVINEYGRI
jgi:hypothetical protein